MPILGPLTLEPKFQLRSGLHIRLSDPCDILQFRSHTSSSSGGKGHATRSALYTDELAHFSDIITGDFLEDKKAGVAVRNVIQKHMLAMDRELARK